MERSAHPTTHTEQRARTWALGAAWHRVERDPRADPASWHPVERPETIGPGERARLSRNRRVLASALAVVLPPLTAVALVPLRDDHGPVVALAMVVPVVVVGTLGALGPALLAAFIAGLSYDLAFTRPYGHVAIDDPDDIVTTVVLVAVALAVGVLCSRLVRTRASDAVRSREVDALVRFARTAVTERDGTVLVDDACATLCGLLGLRQCRWQPGHRGVAGPVLLPGGALMGSLGALSRDRAVLPTGMEIPAVVADREIGRFVVVPDPRLAVSIEERRAALAVVSLFAVAADR